MKGSKASRLKSYEDISDKIQQISPLPSPKTVRGGDLNLVSFRGLALISPIRCLSNRSPGKRPLRVCINKHDPQAQYIHILHAYIQITS
jgi:hypothetical protein